MSLITIIGRGHSGTRAISHTLYASGVYMGSCLNASGDLIPPQAMYEACRVLARHVRWQGDLSWDWSALPQIDIPTEFTDLVESFLKSVLQSKSQHRGWKIPETTLAFPWIVRLFPEAKYIFWIRDPRDCILGGHVTDNLHDFGIDYPATDDERLRRAISWKYQHDLVQSVPKPEHWLEVRFEDFVLRQEETLARLEDFLSMKLARVIVFPETVGRWRRDTGTHYFDFFGPAMANYGYELPAAPDAGDHERVS